MQDPIPASPFNEASFGFDGDPDLATEFNDLVLVPSAKTPDDDIVAVGSTEITNTATNGVIARIKSSGVLDAGFSGGDSTIGYTLLSRRRFRGLVDSNRKQQGAPGRPSYSCENTSAPAI